MTRMASSRNRNTGNLQHLRPKANHPRVSIAFVPSVTQTLISASQPTLNTTEGMLDAFPGPALEQFAVSLSAMGIKSQVIG